MINIEKLSEGIINRFLKKQNLNEIEKAKIQYGLSLIIGILIEFIFVILISMIFKSSYYTSIIMLSSLFLRIGTGGAHCSTYNKCVAFTTIYFIPFSIIAKYSIKILPEIYIFFISSALFAFIFILLRHYLFYKISMLIMLIVNIIFFLLNKYYILGFLFLLSIGFFMQAFMTTSTGLKFVNYADKLMDKVMAKNIFSSVM